MPKDTITEHKMSEDIRKSAFDLINEKGWTKTMVPINTVEREKVLADKMDIQDLQKQIRAFMDNITVLRSALQGLVDAIDLGVSSESLREEENRAIMQPDSVLSLLREAKVALGETM